MAKRCLRRTLLRVRRALRCRAARRSPAGAQRPLPRQADPPGRAVSGGRRDRPDGARPGQKLGERLGQPWSSTTAPAPAARSAPRPWRRAAPDGYTLLFATMGSLTINPSIYKKLRYDPLKSFAPISADAQHVQRAGRASERAGDVGGRADRAGAQAARRADLRFGGQRHHQPPVGRAVQEPGRRRHGARAVQGQRARR